MASVNEAANGAGKHTHSLTTTQKTGFIKWTLVAETELVIATCVIKSSVCVFVLRFLNKTRKGLHFCIYGLIAFMVISTFALVVALLAQCRPLTKLWNPSREGICYPEHVLYSVAYVQGGELS